jgi:hypothetical protein
MPQPTEHKTLKASVSTWAQPGRLRRAWQGPESSREISQQPIQQTASHTEFRTLPTRHELRLESLQHDVLVLAQRFAVSRTTCELLVRSLQTDAALAMIVRDAYAAICSEAEDAVSNTLKGMPGEAAKLLLNRAESTLNAKLMDLAIQTMGRHGQNIDGVEALRNRAQALHTRYRSYGTQVHLGDAGDKRALSLLAKA